MRRAIPPLRSLRAFDAAARHSSFARAADELGVTAAAVSHQVKELEAWSGRELFARGTSGVSLTPGGRQLSAGLSGAFDQIAEAADASRRMPARNVTVRCQLSLAARWLSPRIADFLARFPDIDLQVVAAPYPEMPVGDAADLSIYYTRGPVAGLRQDRLAAGQVIVAGAPRLAGREGPGHSPPQLRDLPLLHTRPADRGWREPDWATWFEAADPCRRPPPRKGVSFNYQHLALEACKAGAGFALVTDIFVESDLASGALSQACAFTLPSPHAYYVMAAAPALERPEVAAVHGWLLSQAAS